MDGYVGQRAKKRKRKFFLFFFLFVVFIVIFYFFPKLQLQKTPLSDSLLPTKEDIDLNSISSTIEELELKNFDKEQKILFRDKNIEKLKDELKILSYKNTNLLKSVDNLKNIINSLSNNDNLEEDKNKLNEKIKKDHLSKIQKLKDDIAKLQIKNKNILKEIEIHISQKNSKDDEFQNIFNKNLKLKNLNEVNNIKIRDLEDHIEEQNLIITILKDSNPHS